MPSFVPSSSSSSSPSSLNFQFLGELHRSLCCCHHSLCRHSHCCHHHHLHHQHDHYIFIIVVVLFLFLLLVTIILINMNFLASCSLVALSSWALVNQAEFNTSFSFFFIILIPNWCFSRKRMPRGLSLGKSSLGKSAECLGVIEKLQTNFGQTDFAEGGGPERKTQKDVSFCK